MKSIFRRIKNRIRGIFPSSGKKRSFSIYDRNGPNYATILVETRCGNRCLYCVNHNKDAANCSQTTGIYIHKNLSLTLEQFKRQVDILKENKVPKIHICGAGEPFFNPHMMDFIDYVIKQYGSVSFQTNFRQVFKDFIPDVAKRKIAYIGTDLVGGTKETFERIKVGSKWDDLWSNVEYLEKEAEKHGNFIPVHMYAVVNRQEISHENIENMVKKCLDYKSIKQLVFHNIHAFGFNEFVNFENVIKEDDREIIKRFEKAKEMAAAQGLQITGPAYYRYAKEFNCKNFWSRIMLNFPNQKIPEEKWIGNVMPGGCLAETMGDMYSIGNIFEDHFLEIWNSEKMIKARTLALEGRFADPYCEICPAHYIEQE